MYNSITKPKFNNRKSYYDDVFKDKKASLKKVVPKKTSDEEDILKLNSNIAKALNPKGTNSESPALPKTTVSSTKSNTTVIAPKTTDSDDILKLNNNIASSLSPKGTNSESPALPKTTGSAIKSNITNVLSKKYGELGTRNLFNDIDDKSVEDNLPTAENAIKTSVDKGLLSKNYSSLLPNLRDGLALSYAAAGKGNSKAATRAREAAYTNAENLSKLRNALSSLDDKADNGGYNIPKPKPLGADATVTREKDKPVSLASISGLTYNKGKTAEPAKYNNSFGDYDKKLLTKDEGSGVSEKNGFKNFSNKYTTNNLVEEKQDKTSDTPDFIPQPQRVSSEINRYTTEDFIKDIQNSYTGASSVIALKDFFGSTKKFVSGVSHKITNNKDMDEYDILAPFVDFVRANPLNSLPLGVSKAVSRAIWKYAGCDNYLKSRNLTFSADLLEHSLQDNPTDVRFFDDSVVAKKLRTDKGLIKEVNRLANIFEKDPIKAINKGFEFNEGDMFYSIHGCTVEVTDIRPMNNHRVISVHITDNYDYTKIWTAMGENGISFGSFANDMGTLSTLFDAINPYKVDIYLTIRS